MRLAGHRDAGRKVILRFVYADDGVLNACGRADATSMGVIETHLAQLEPILVDHVDVISYVEAGFFGMWGEWNDEHAPEGTILRQDPANRRQLVEMLLVTVPAPRPILLRRPRFRWELEPLLTDEQLSRIGFHNDCFLASDTDYGTYDGDLTIEQWKDYIHEATRTAPMGGETCNDDPTYTSCSNAIADLQRLRFTYIHQNYNAAVIDRWREEGCFDRIVRGLGYRIFLHTLHTPAEVEPGGVVQVILDVQNDGFAPPYTTRRFLLVLRSGDTAVELDTRALEGADTRDWQPGLITRVRLEADVPDDVAPSEYELRLRLLDDLSDQVSYRMLFANDATVRDDELRENRLATITVR